VAWSPDGLKLAAGEAEGIIWDWDLPSVNNFLNIKAIVPGQSTIRIWDWRTGKTLTSLAAPEGRMTTLAWHPDGRRLLATCGQPGSDELTLWDSATGRRITGWSAGAERGGAAFSPDGRRLVWGHYPARVTDLDSGQVVLSSQGKSSGTWSPLGDRLASLAGKEISVWDTASGEDLYSIPGHLAGAFWLSWSPKGDLLAASCADRAVETLRVWDAAGGKVAHSVTPGGWSSVTFCPEGIGVLMAAQGELLRAYDVQSGKVSACGQHPLNPPGKPVWSSDGKRFAASTQVHADTRGWSLLICDGKTGAGLVPPIQCKDPPGPMAWNPDGSVLAVAFGTPGLVGEWLSRGRVELFSASTDKVLASSSEVAGRLQMLAWSPDGRRLAGAGEGGPLRIWDSSLRPQPIAMTDQARCLDWSPDGKKLVAAGSWEGLIAIYEASSGTLLHILRAPGAIVAVRWHPWMPRIATGGRDGMIRIWDSSTAQEICAFQTPDSIVRELAWSAEGWRLVSTGDDGSVRIWDASPAVRFLKRHQEIRDKVWKLIPGSWKGQQVTDAQFREALAQLKQLIALNPEDRDAKWQTLCVEWFRAVQLARSGRTDEAIALFQRLCAESSDMPDYRHALPGQLFLVGKESEGIAILEKWVAELPQRPEYHEELAFLYERRAIQLCQSGRLPEAIVILRKLAKEFPERPGHRSQMVRLLTAQLPAEQMIAVLRKLGQEFPDAPEYREEAGVRVNLGILLTRKEDFAEAEAQLREALWLRPDYPEAHAELAVALACQGKYAEAEAEYRLAPKLRPSAQEAFVSPSWAMRGSQKFAAAARLLAAAIAAEPNLAVDSGTTLRYNAASAAALAGCGQGEDAARLDDAERARLRRQALDWLRADLAAWGQLLEKSRNQTRSLVQQKLRHWQEDPDFNGLRGAALVRLPEAERQAWQQLWTDVEQMLKRVSQ
jgi:WD40 repeat protein/Flp pilus assembly protein TadD